MAQYYEEAEKELPGVLHAEKANATINPQEAVLHLPNSNRRVLRRIDRVLMPLMFISYGLQYMDKAILGASSQFGVIQEVGLYDVVVITGTPTVDLKKFSNATLMFYWGFAVGAFPASYLSQRFPIGVFCGVSMAVWGAVTMATALVTSYAGMMTIRHDVPPLSLHICLLLYVNMWTLVRFFLGVVEAAIPAAFSLIVGMWYKKDEHPLRFAIWVSASGLGGVVGTCLLWAIGHINGSLSPWKYQFIILGVITMAWGLFIALVMPKSPTSARFLSDDDKILAVERMRAGQTGIENDGFKMYQVKEAFLDLKTWAFVIIAFSCELVNGAVSGFSTIIITSFGFDPFQSVLVAGAMGAVVFFSVIVSGIISAYMPNQRCNIAFVMTLPVVAGCVVVWKVSWASVGVPLFGFMLLGFFTAPYIMVLAMVTANTGGQTKKLVTTALVWCAYCVSNGVAPLLVSSTEVSRHYPSLFIPIISFISFSLLVILVLRWYLKFYNKQKESAGSDDGASSAQTAFLDMTDKENPNFRYSY
ncbi:MFS general substrate transporter [Thozetella sp. PMI_491]|nr:MFS general substrate transporter [Thozetella sp. PMI_491]